jgi:hypothetical protein
MQKGSLSLEGSLLVMRSRVCAAALTRRNAHGMTLYDL